MKQFQLNLIEVLKSSLFGTIPNYYGVVDWNEIIIEAKAQTVVGLISSSLPNHIEMDDQAKAQYMRIMFEQDRLLKLFEINRIPCVVLKGFAVATYYPKPYLRTMGDVDLLVPRLHFLDAVNLVESNKFSYIEGKDSDGHITNMTREIEYSKNGVIFEIHHHFSSPGFDIDDILEDAIKLREYRQLNGFNFPVLPDIENGLVLLGHINQHLKNSVLGLRQIIDWEMYVHSVAGDESWYDGFAPLAKKAGLIQLAAYVTRMCNKHLGLPEVVDWGADVDDVLVDELLEVVMHDGNFGRKVNSDLSSEEMKVRGTFYSIKHVGFLPYFRNVGMNKWSFSRRHPVLKPLAFVYGVIITAGKGIKAFFKNRGIGKQISEGNKRYKLYKKLGVRSGGSKGGELLNQIKRKGQ